jgi:hypothetical protein
MAVVATGILRMKTISSGCKFTKLRYHSIFTSNELKSKKSAILIVIKFYIHM